MARQKKRKLPKIEVGSEWATKNYGRCKVESYISNREIWIRFEDTGSLVKTCGEVLRRGSSRDPYKPVICGIGYQGEGVKAKLSDGSSNPVYSIWRQMLNRCYNINHIKYHRYGGRGYTVCDEWHNFQNYYNWYCENYKDGYQVDKDLTSPNSKTYSPENCSFVPPQINVMLTSNVARRGVYPVGVHCWKNKDVGTKRFTAHLSHKWKGGAGKTLGYFDSPEEAFTCYKRAKEKQTKEIATIYYNSGEICKEVYDTLMNWVVEPFPS